MIKKIFLAVFSFLITGLQFLKIYEIEEYGYSLDKGMSINETNYNFIVAMTQSSFGGFEKFLMVLFFIIPILAGIYFLQSIWTKFSSTNLDLCVILFLLCSGLSVFMLTSVLGHFVSVLGFIPLVVYIIIQIKEA